MPTPDPLLDGLASVVGDGTATVVHVGAGAGRVLDRYADLAPRRVVLVEGDPDTAAELQRRAAAFPWATVHADVVAPAAGSVEWHRYSLSALNGPLDALALKSYYPRLRLLGSQPRPARPLASLLDGLDLASDTGPRVLVLDVPGQEGALLEALSKDALGHFDAIVLRGCSQALGGDGAPAAQVLLAMKARYWRVEPDDADVDPLWPVTLLRLDRRRHDEQFWRQQIEGLENTSRLHEQEAARLGAANATLTEQLAAAARLAAERQSDLALARQAYTTLTERAAVLEQRLQETQAVSEQRLQEIQAASEQRLQETQAAAEQRLQETQAVLQQRLQETQAALAQKEQEAGQATAGLELLQRQLAEQAALDAGRLQELQAAQLHAQGLAAQVDALGAAVHQADASAQAVQAELAAERSRLAEERQALSARCESQAAELQALQSTLEQQRAEAARLAAELEASQQARTGLQQQVQLLTFGLEERQRQLDQATGAASELDARHGQTIEALRRELAEARNTSGMAVKLQMLREADLQELQQRHANALAQLDAQQDLLGRLAQRLSAANQYFLQLALPAGDQPAAEAPVLKSAPPKAPKAPKKQPTAASGSGRGTRARPSRKGEAADKSAPKVEPAGVDSDAQTP